jgi:hypothetical protein
LRAVVATLDSLVN